MNIEIRFNTEKNYDLQYESTQHNLNVICFDNVNNMYSIVHCHNAIGILRRLHIALSSIYHFSVTLYNCLHDLKLFLCDLI